MSKPLRKLPYDYPMPKQTEKDLRQRVRGLFRAIDNLSGGTPSDVRERYLDEATDKVLVIIAQERDSYATTKAVGALEKVKQEMKTWAYETIERTGDRELSSTPHAVKVRSVTQAAAAIIDQEIATLRREQ